MYVFFILFLVLSVTSTTKSSIDMIFLNKNIHNNKNDLDVFSMWRNDAWI